MQTKKQNSNSEGVYKIEIINKKIIAIKRERKEERMKKMHITICKHLKNVLYKLSEWPCFWNTFLMFLDSGTLSLNATKNIDRHGTRLEISVN